jgi:predicted RNA-binding protein with PUA-like domain
MANQINYYLIKSEPYKYSINDLEREQTTLWDGVRNYQAINNIKKWQIGDLLYFYHSVKETRIVGIAEVIDEPFLNTEDERFSFACQIKFIKKLSEEISNKLTLKKIKEYNLDTNQFKDFGLIKQSRLSVVPCPTEFVNWVSEAAEDKIV